MLPLNPTRRLSRSVLWLWLPAALFVAIVAWQVLGPTPIGLANNDDFAKVLGHFGFWPITSVAGVRDDHTLFKYFAPEYIFRYPVWDSGIPSSAFVTAGAAARIARVALPPGRFDLRIVGAIHGLEMTLALVCFLLAIRHQKLWIRIFSTALILWMWTDVMYVQQLSTAYSDAEAVTGLCLTFAFTVMALLSVGNNSWIPAVGFVATSALLIGSKLQHVDAMVPLAGFALLMAVRGGLPWHARAVWCATPLILAGTAFFLMTGTPDDYRTAPSFTLVFSKLAVVSGNPAGVLAAFRMLPEEFQKYVGHYYYQPIVPADDALFRERVRTLVTPGRIVTFYLHNPSVAEGVLRKDWMENASDVNLSGYGDMREADVARGKTSPEFNLWSGLRQRLFRAIPLYPVVFFAAALSLLAAGGASRNLRNQAPLWPLPGMVTIIAVGCLLSGSLLDAAETARHLLLFQVATDLTILALLVAYGTRTRIVPSPLLST